MSCDLRHLVVVSLGVGLLLAMPLTSVAAGEPTQPTPSATRIAVVAPPLTLPPAAQGHMQVSPALASVSAGQAFQLQVVSNTTVVTRGAQFGVSYDPGLFEVVGVTQGPLYRDWAAQRNLNTAVVHWATTGGQATLSTGSQNIAMFSTAAAGSARAGQTTVGGEAILGGSGLEGPSGTGVFATIQLRARPGAGGSGKIALTDVLYGVMVPDTRTHQPVVVAPGENPCIRARACAAISLHDQHPSPATVTVLGAAK